jgi:diguanylate cyclase (GGDEF)-like protein/PAS domain S-box-containing protein/putative nucleotidyltransferase with HDIG domain
MLADTLLGGTLLFSVLYLEFAVLSSIILAAGTMEYIGKKNLSIFLTLGVANMIWILVSKALHLPFLALTLPPFGYMGLVYIITGITLICSSKEIKPIGQILGLTFILWGVHKIDYPFTRTIAWFAPVGYIMGETFALMAAVGILILYFQITKRQLAESEEKYKSYVSNSPDAIFVVNSDGRYIDVNESACRLTGYTKEEMLKIGISDIIHPESKNAAITDFMRLKETGKTSEEYLFVRKDGSEYIMSVDAVKMKNNTFLAFCRDITDRIKARNALDEASKFNQDIINSANCGIIVYDTELRYRIWNPYMERLSGISAKDVIDRSAEQAFPWLEGEGVIESLKGILTSERTVKRDIHFSVPESGFSGWAADSSTPLYNSKGETIGVLGIVQDITDRKNAEDNLIFLSYHDQLTGLYNRRYFDEELSRFEAEPYLPTSIIMIDINGLKVANDSFGHTLGDEIIRKTAETLREACDPGVIAARIGGDEFVVLMPNTDRVSAEKAIERIKYFEAKKKVGDLELSLSIGYDTLDCGDQTIEQTLINAENDMYKHKISERTSNRSKIVDIVMNALFEKSKRESMHSKRVSALCRELAVHMNLDQDVSNRVGMAGLLHDIGKIGIDEAILNKAEKLTDEERTQIEKHPEIGWRILSASDEFSDLANIVLKHHERWDGTGYPSGLRNNQIPLESRIIALADSYDAMTNERSYKKALDKESALQEIRRCSGTQFDPAIVDVFINKVVKRVNFR